MEDKKYKLSYTGAALNTILGKGHTHNSDTMLNEGGVNEITAEELTTLKNITVPGVAEELATLKEDLSLGGVPDFTAAVAANTIHSAIVNGNPHNVTKAEVGLSNVANTDLTSAVLANTSHRSAVSGNPHHVTKAEVGLNNVVNTDFTSAVLANTSHRSAVSGNPHNVTKVDVGLGNVVNTDLTPAVAANTTAVAACTIHKNLGSGNPHNVTKADVGLANVPNEDATNMDTWDQKGATVGQCPTWSMTLSKWVPGSLDRIQYVRRSSNTILGTADHSSIIDITSETFSQTFSSAAVLGVGWFCYFKNSGTGNITVTPYGSELIDGLASYIIYPGECRLFQSNGFAEITSLVLNGFSTVFTASGSFVKPPGYNFFSGLLWGAGAGGTFYSIHLGSGAGGGACVPFEIVSSQQGATLAVTIGSGGGANTPGGNSSITISGKTIIAYGGGAGYAGRGGGGGSDIGPGDADGNGGGYQPLRADQSIILQVSPGKQGYGGTSFAYGGNATGLNGAGGANQGVNMVGTYKGGNSEYGGAGGGNGNEPGYPAGPGGDSVYGGAGGGGYGSSGGTSKFGGNGGSISGNGAAPGGGGSGGVPPNIPAGIGGRGEMRIWGVI